MFTWLIPENIKAQGQRRHYVNELGSLNIVLRESCASTYAGRW